MKIINIMNQYFKVYIVYGIIFNLIIYPTNLSAQAGDISGNIMGMIDTFGQRINQLNQTTYQNQAQMASLQRAQQLMQANSPKAPDSSNKFPNCALPSDNQVPPVVCQGLNKESDVVLAQQMIFMGQQHTIFLDIMLNGTSDASPNNAGIACMDEAIKRHSQLFQSKINSLTAYKDRYNKEIQIIKKHLQPSLDEMDNLHYEIAGGKAKNEKQKSLNLEGLFTGSSCQGIVDAGIYKSREGLRGVSKSLTKAGKNGKSLYGQAANLMSDAGNIEKQVENQIKRIIEDVTIYGAGFNPLKSNLNRGGEYIYKEMILAIKAKTGTIANRHREIKDQLVRDFPGFNLPAMDKHFETNINGVNAEDYFRKKLVNDCVTMKDKTGSGFTNEQIISMLDAPGFGSRSPTYKNYRDEFVDIYSDDTVFISDKIEQIKDLDKKYHGRIILKGSFTSGKNTPKSPYFVLKSIIDKCNKNLNDSNALSAKSGERDARSGHNKAIEAQNLLTELKTLNRKFAGDLAQEIRNRVLNCSEETQTTSNCNANTLSPTKSGFCLNNAKACASRVEDCQTLATKLIDTRVNKIKIHASTYRHNVKALTDETERTLNVLKEQVFADLAFFTEKFPDVKIPRPEGLFIKTPDDSMSPFGVKLPGGGHPQSKFDFMKELPKKIDALIVTLKQADKGVQETGYAEIKKQRKKLKKSQQQWDDFRKECSQKIVDIHMATQKQKEAALKQQQEQMKALQEILGEKRNFCRKYHGLAEMTPGPGCELVKDLADDLSDISMTIMDPNEVSYYLNQYRNLCDSINNKQKDEEDKEDEVNFANLCLANSYNWDAVKKELISDLEGKIPYDIDDDFDLKEFLKTEEEKKDDDEKKKDKVSSAFSNFFSNNDDDDDDDDDIPSIGNFYFAQKALNLKKLFAVASEQADKMKSDNSLDDFKKRLDGYKSQPDISNAEILKEIKLIEDQIPSKKIVKESKSIEKHTLRSDTYSDNIISKMKEKYSYQDPLKYIRKVPADINIKKPVPKRYYKTTQEIPKVTKEINQDKLKHIQKIKEALKNNDRQAAMEELSALAKNIEKDKDNNFGTAQVKAENLSKKIEKDITKAKDNKTKNNAIEALKGKFSQGDADPCAIAQREMLMNIVVACKGNDNLINCYNEKETEAFTKGEGLSLDSRNLDINLKKYLLIPIESPDSEVWDGMGENLRGTCIGEDDTQRGMPNSQRRSGQQEQRPGESSVRTY